MCKKRRTPKAGRAVVTMAAVLLLRVAVGSGATINGRVVTDKGIYNIGDTVYWTAHVWASKGDNRGVALLSADMEDDTADILNLPGIAGNDFAGTAYGNAVKFVKLADPVISLVSPELRGILVMQLPEDRRLDVGNDGRTDRVFVQGSYMVTEYGWHTLGLILNAANYWPDSVSLMAKAFETVNSNPARFRVGLLEGDISGDGCVNLADFSVLAEWWAGSGCEWSSYCNGADVTGDGVVDAADVAILAGQWLSCDHPDQVGLEGDINQDHYVNLADLAIVAEWWASAACGAAPYCDGADVVSDGVVDLGDVAVIASQWLWCNDPGNAACGTFQN